jgi:hypothetical protein
MKKLLNIIILTGLLISICNIAFAEKLPPLGYKKDLNSVDNPIWYKYLYDYKDQLYKAFDARKFRKKEWGHIFIYTINRDGSITNMIKYDTLDKCDKYIRQVILDNPPPPFPKEIEENRIRIHTSLWSSGDNEFILDYYPHKNMAWLVISKDTKYKK